LGHIGHGTLRVDSGMPRAGVTIIELLAVLAIVGVLAALAVGRGHDSVARAQLARLKVEARQLEAAEQVYLAESGHFYNGPFTPDALREAGMAYAPSEAVEAVVGIGTATTLALSLIWRTAIAGDPSPYCRIRLDATNETATVVSCTLPAPRDEFGPVPTSSGSQASDSGHP
jgi:prepilin-type N-terminal cleavage/methylation domain-containing protein